ncbi:RNA polymerase sigma factor [Paraglaciecola polaris]|uniref:RNA polymerase sigma-70 factor, ECF subfamily n=1 Tax=Paraglaciecola polaris LMG 21857 TaxID=1129793 RepID=K7A642_9ALTE|nr:sigma-70 family RNA polymerase sigma factor [Paraglaciecola polaris]GAC30950.1 RNA polymerase sigma-70 factor, ECF subfamily [Paraglaciecola polaris LMG 21857]|tara:strand:+ start:5012 stop:5542 length:531 start_codon:yes stop_codon:yes gene_type:complete
MTNNTVSRNSRFIKGLYDSSYKELFAFLLRRSKNKQQAQDFSQEAYLRLMRVERTDLIEQPKAYLFRIAANLVHEVRIKSDRQAEKDTCSLDGIEEIASDDDPQSNFEMQKAITDLENILSGLPAIYQSILLMRKRDGLKHAEIAQKLGISIHTVRKYLTRAITECRKAHSMSKEL